MIWSPSLIEGETLFWSHEFSITDRLKGEETTEVVSKVEKMKCCDSVVTVVQFCYMNKG